MTRSSAITRTILNLQRSNRAFSTSIRTMSEGSTGSGAAKGGYGGGQKDAFSSREKANEDAYVRQQELTKQRLKDARQNVTDLGKDLDRQINELDNEGKQEKK